MQAVRMQGEENKERGDGQRRHLSRDRDDATFYIWQGESYRRKTLCLRIWCTMRLLTFVLCGTLGMKLYSGLLMSWKVAACTQGGGVDI